jgi:hypothetical protein
MAESWLTVGEIADMVFDAVESAITALTTLPGDATTDERRAAMRADFDQRRAAGQDHQADDPPATTRAEARQARRRARWGGE